MTISEVGPSRCALHKATSRVISSECSKVFRLTTWWIRPHLTLALSPKTGRMIVFSGGHASGFRNIHDYDSYDVDGTRLFHVRHPQSKDTRRMKHESYFPFSTNRCAVSLRTTCEPSKLPRKRPVSTRMIRSSWKLHPALTYGTAR